MLLTEIGKFPYAHYEAPSVDTRTVSTSSVYECRFSYFLLELAKLWGPSFDYINIISYLKTHCEIVSFDLAFKLLMEF